MDKSLKAGGERGGPKQQESMTLAYDETVITRGVQESQKGIQFEKEGSGRYAYDDDLLFV